MRAGIVAVAALLAGRVAPAGRCSPQMLQYIDATKNITLYNATDNSTSSVMAGLPARPEMPGLPPFFTSILPSGQLCYTGGGSGMVYDPDDTCPCNPRLNFTDCSKMTTIFDPPFILEQGAVSNSSIFKTEGRICANPAIEVTSYARSKGRIAPWEYNELQNPASACTCPQQPEFIRKVYGESDPKVSGYLGKLKGIGKLRKPQPSPPRTELKSTGNPDLGTCQVLQLGIGWAGSQETAVPISGSGDAVLEINATSEDVPFTPEKPYPGEPCGGTKNMNSRSNFCLYPSGGLEDTEDYAIVAASVTQLSEFCSNNTALTGGTRFSECCMRVEVEFIPHGPGGSSSVSQTENATIIRRDLMLFLQCKSAMYAINSGTGRYHTPPTMKRALDNFTNTDSSAGLAEGNFMQSMSQQEHVRKSYAEAGFSDVCIPDSKQVKGTCTEFTKVNIVNIVTDGDGPGKLDPKVFAAGMYDKPSSCKDILGRPSPMAGSEPPTGTDAHYLANTFVGQWSALRQSAAPWNTCVMPSTFASTGKPVREFIDPCKAIKYYNTMPQLFSDPNVGWVNDDFGKCLPSDVPVLVQGFYRALVGDGGGAPDMVRWWASMPPAFYLSVASLPSAVADYFTTTDNRCFQDQHTVLPLPTAPAAFSPPDPEANCSTESLADSSTAGIPPGNETVTTRMNATMVQQIINDCLNSRLNNAGTGSRFCTFTGQLADRRFKFWKKSATTPFALFSPSEAQPTLCTNNTSGKVKIGNGDIIFVATGFRPSGAPIHPVFQAANYIGGMADQESPKGEYGTDYNFHLIATGFTHSNLNAQFQLPFLYQYANGTPATTDSERGGGAIPNLYPNDPNTDTMFYDGVELNPIADFDCLTKNHRGARNYVNKATDKSDTTIPIPGRWPRWIDLVQNPGAENEEGKNFGGLFSDLFPKYPGAVVVKGCAEVQTNCHPKRGCGFGGSSSTCVVCDKSLEPKPTFCQELGNVATGGDRFAVDLYQYGGGNGLSGTNQLSFKNPTGAKGNLTFFVAHTMGYNYVNNIDTTAINGNSNIPDSGGLDAVPMLPTLGFCVSADAARSSNKPTTLTDWRELYQATLNATMDKKSDFLFRSALNETADVSSLLDLYRNYPSMRRACLNESVSGECVGLPTDTQNPSMAAWNGKNGWVSKMAKMRPDVTGYMRYNMKSAGETANDMYASRYYSNNPKVSSKNGNVDNAVCSKSGKPASLGAGCGPGSNTYWVSGSNFFGVAPPTTGPNNLNLGKNKTAFSTQQGTQSSWWAGRTAMLESATVGLQIGCMVAKKGSGEFKLSGSFVKTNNFAKGQQVTQYTTADKSGNPKAPVLGFTMFNGTATDTLFGDGTPAYTAVDGDGNPLDIMSRFGKRYMCGLCAAIGAATDHSPRRSDPQKCTAGPSGEYHIRYNIQESLGVYDAHANNFFTNRTHLYNRSAAKIKRVDFSYFNSLGTNQSGFTWTEGEDTLEGEKIQRLLGVNLKSGFAVDTPPCRGDLYMATSPYCEIDQNLFVSEEGEKITCVPAKSSYGTSCPSPRWSNDYRVTFPTTIPGNAPVPEKDIDFDARAARVSYCANGPWNFSDPGWYSKSNADLLSLPNTNRTTSAAYVRCDGDPRTPEARKAFCAGSPDTYTPEAYITTFGIVPGKKTRVGDMCRPNLLGGHTCVVFASDIESTVNNFQTIIDAFPDTSDTQISFMAVPVAERVVAEAILLYQTDVSTLYFNDPTNVDSKAYKESATTAPKSVLGTLANVSWDVSERLFSGSCFNQMDDAYFAQLYAVVEKFRTGPTSTGFTFVNLGGDAPTMQRKVEMTEEQVYPVHVEQMIDAGSRVVQFDSAFTTNVARDATERLREFGGRSANRTLKERKFRLGGMVGTTSCARFLVQQVNTTIQNFEFDQGAICAELLPEFARVPVVAGGNRIDNSKIFGCTCVNCPSGIVQVAGGDEQLPSDTRAAANIAVNNLTVSNSKFYWNSENEMPATASSDRARPCAAKLSECQNSTFSGVQTSFARIVGDPTVLECAAERGDESENPTPLTQYCDVVMRYSQVKLDTLVVPTSPITTQKPVDASLGCSSACNATQREYDILFGDSLRTSPPLAPCCDGSPIEITYSCTDAAGVLVSSNYVEGHPKGACSSENCLWAATTTSPWTNQTSVEVIKEYSSFPDWDPNMFGDICKLFYTVCTAGTCPGNSTAPCETCNSNKTFWNTCPNMDGGHPMIPPPCATSGSATFTNGVSIASPSTSPETFTAEVLYRFYGQTVDGVFCSTLGCPNALQYTQKESLRYGFPICVPESDNLETIPRRIRQFWTVSADTYNNSERMFFPEVVNIVSPGVPGVLFPLPYEFEAGVLNGPRPVHSNANFSLLNTYFSDPSSGVFTAQIGIVVDTEEPTVCLSRPATLTQTGTEAGGPLEARLCSGQDPSQAFLFVLERSINAYRIQVPMDPFMCMTIETLGNETGQTPAGVNETFPQLPGRTGAVPVLTACYPCSVGVDTVGTGSGPVVSSVLEFPTIFHETPWQYARSDNVIGVPLSVSDPRLMLLVNLSTGMCLQTEAAPQHALFAPDTPGNTTRVVGEVPCSLLEGAPVAQIIKEAGGDSDVCKEAAGMLVAPCDARTGGISLVDATAAAISTLCTPSTTEFQKPFGVNSRGGRGATIMCTKIHPGDTDRVLEIVSAGTGYRDNERLYAANESALNNATFTQLQFIARVQKMIWQPSTSSESVASAPIVSVATEVFNTSALFDIFGEASLFAVYAAEVKSATASYVIFSIEVGIIVSGITFHLFKLFKARSRRAPGAS